MIGKLLWHRAVKSYAHFNPSYVPFRGELIITVPAHFVDDPLKTLKYGDVKRLLLNAAIKHLLKGQPQPTAMWDMTGAVVIDWISPRVASAIITLYTPDFDVWTWLCTQKFYQSIEP